NLEDGHFTIMTNREETLIDQADLAARWPGKFLTLWHAPPSGKTTIIPGSPEDDILWLWQQLQALALIAPTATAPDRFTTRLTQAIRAFQKSHGLQVDGIAGMRTLLALEQATHPDSIPLLIKTTQRGSH
ncbi:MAG TPA: peptidoglycan-binding protein, partial [Gammaproteobacteria bacterium]|nr:peptidoglycan-binding protein [Gammaproteobacteria bacterium]